LILIFPLNGKTEGWARNRVAGVPPVRASLKSAEKNNSIRTAEAVRMELFTMVRRVPVEDRPADRVEEDVRRFHGRPGGMSPEPVGGRDSPADQAGRRSVELSRQMTV